MRGWDRRSGKLVSCVDVETRVRSHHPLRAIRLIGNETLEALSGAFESVAGAGWPLVDAVFDWIKAVAGLRKTRFIGRAWTDRAFPFAAAACSLVRLPTLSATAG